jgi:hypothetical protein
MGSPAVRIWEWTLATKRAHDHTQRSARALTTTGHAVASGGHALSVSPDRVTVGSNGDNFPRASVWRGTMRPIEIAGTLAVIFG